MAFAEPQGDRLTFFATDCLSTVAARSMTAKTAMMTQLLQSTNTGNACEPMRSNSWPMTHGKNIEPDVDAVNSKPLILPVTFSRRPAKVNMAGNTDAVDRPMPNTPAHANAGTSIPSNNTAPLTAKPSTSPTNAPFG